MRNVNRTRYVLISVTGVLALTLCFNNCAPLRSATHLDFQSDQSSTFSSANAVCDGQLKAAFQRTYHPFLVTNCNACHGQSHGSTDLTISFNAFRKKGEELIDYQATHAHGGNTFGSFMQPKIDVFKPSWGQAMDNYDECLSEVLSGSQGSFVKNLSLSGKSQIPNLMNTLNNNNWVPIQWDLETDVASAHRGKFAATLKIEARLNKGSDGALEGLLLRNPVLRLKSGSQNIQISGLMVILDEKVQVQVTTYSGISKVVGGTEDVALVAGSGAAYVVAPGVSDATKIGLQIGEISHTKLQPESSNPPVVGPIVAVDLPNVPIPNGGATFTQLITSNSPYRVFDRSCASCHNGNGQFNIRDYATASARAALIMERMNNMANPMPPTGRLRENDRDLVQSWVNAGAPR